MKIGNGDGILSIATHGRSSRARSVQVKPRLTTAAEHHDGRGAGEVAMKSVVLHLLEHVRAGAGLIAGAGAGHALDDHVAAKLAGND